MRRSFSDSPGGNKSLGSANAAPISTANIRGSVRRGNSESVRYEPVSVGVAEGAVEEPQITHDPVLDPHIPFPHPPPPAFPSSYSHKHDQHGHTLHPHSHHSHLYSNQNMLPPFQPRPSKPQRQISRQVSSATHNHPQKQQNFGRFLSRMMSMSGPLSPVNEGDSGDDASSNSSYGDYLDRIGEIDVELQNTISEQLAIEQHCSTQEEIIERELEKEAEKQAELIERREEKKLTFLQRLDKKFCMLAVVRTKIADTEDFPLYW